jgi:hypothetical protein
MSDQEARRLLRDCVDHYRRRPYAELRQACGDSPAMVDVAGRSGAHYRISVHVVPDDNDQRMGAIRVIARISGDASLERLRDEFTVAPKSPDRAGV